MPKFRPWVPVQLFGQLFVPLTQGLWTMIDPDDLPLVEGRAWRADHPERVRSPTYAVESRSTAHQMHRVILGLPPGDPRMGDHINGNGLDNRRCNLRIVTAHQNAMNRRGWRTSTSKYMGVSWDRTNQKWRAQITYERTPYDLGRFDDEEEAARAYDAASLRFRGEYARLNIPSAPTP